MEKLKFGFIALVFICITGCGGGGGSSSTISSSSSTSSSTNSIETASNTSAQKPDILPSGVVLSINPDITLSSELLSGNSVNASYENSNFSTDFPSGNHDVLVSRVDSGDKIELSFTVSGKLVKLVLDNFWDIGGTGHTDGFTVSAEIDGREIASQSGFFRGRKPLNKKVSDTVNIYRTPSETEFYRYFVGKYVYSEVTTVDNSQVPENAFGTSGLIRLNSDKTYESSGASSSSTNQKWKHMYSNGQHTIEFSSDEVEYGQKFKVTVTYELQFTDFTEGTWRIPKVSVEDSEGDKIIIDSSQLDNGYATGKWNMFNET